MGGRKFYLWLCVSNMNWVEILGVIVGSGGVGSLITALMMAKYKRQAAALENEKSALVNEAQEIANKHSELQEWRDISEERKGRIDEMHEALTKESDRYDAMVARKNAELDKKDAEIERLNNKIDILYADLAKKREQIDTLSSENTALTIFRCDKVGCADRQPPFAYQVPSIH